MPKHSFRDLFKDIAIYGLGDILLRATAFITMPIYTRIFAPEDFGVLSFINTGVNLFSGVLILGGNSAYALFFFEAKTRPEKQLITSTWLGFLSLWSLAIILLSLPFTGALSRWSFRTDQYRLLCALGLLSVPVSLINTMCGQVLRNQFQARLFTTLSVISSLLTIGLGLFGAVILKMGLTGVIGGGLIAGILILPVRLWTAREMLRPMFSARMLQKLLAYGVPLVPMTLAYWVFEVSDRLILAKLSTLGQLGLYAVANGATSILIFANVSLGQAWSPHAIRIYEDQPEFAKAFFGQMMTYILVGFGVLCVGLTVFAREILMILATPPFYPAALAIGPLALGAVAYASTQVTALGISLSKKTKYFAFFSWAAAILNFVLNILFVPRWGMMAASWSTAVSYIFLTAVYLITSQRLRPVDYEKRRLITVITLTIGFTVAAPLLPGFDSITTIILKIAYCLTYVALLLTFHVIDQREGSMILRTLRGLRIRRVREEL